MKDWDYANLTHDAKEHGGPQKFINEVYEDGRYDGRVEGGVVAAIGTFVFTVIGSLAILRIKKIYEKHKAKTAADEAALAQIIEAEIAYTKDEFSEESFNSAASTDKMTAEEKSDVVKPNTTEPIHTNENNDTN